MQAASVDFSSKVTQAPKNGERVYPRALIAETTSHLPFRDRHSPPHLCQIFPGWLTIVFLSLSGVSLILTICFLVIYWKKLKAKIRALFVRDQQDPEVMGPLFAEDEGRDDYDSKAIKRLCKSHSKMVGVPGQGGVYRDPHAEDRRDGQRYDPPSPSDSPKREGDLLEPDLNHLYPEDDSHSDDGSSHRSKKGGVRSWFAKLTKEPRRDVDQV